MAEESMQQATEIIEPEKMAYLPTYRQVLRVILFPDMIDHQLPQKKSHFAVLIIYRLMSRNFTAQNDICW